MSKLGCYCGHTIRDQTNHLPYKAELIPDMDNGKLWDIVASGGGVPAKYRDDQDEIFYAISDLTRPIFRTLYQCSECGRIYIENLQGGFECYKPNHEGTSKNILEGRHRQSDEKSLQEQFRDHWAARDEHLAKIEDYKNARARGERPRPPSFSSFSELLPTTTSGKRVQIDRTEEYLSRVFDEIKRPVIDSTLLERGNQYIKIKHGLSTKFPSDPRYYSTSITNISKIEIIITKFAGFYESNGNLVLNTASGDFYSRIQFNEWFSVPENGWIAPDKCYTDWGNYGGGGKSLWVYWGADENGKEFIASIPCPY